ncbi:MAG: PEP-CTERM sorting domain-containing protein [Nitrospira sp.]|nr:MAG: PEP-CTERM sorting domain-containing protein [Nitrospira sp.]
MMRRRGMSVGLGVMVWGILSLSVAIAPATADPVTFQFTGEVFSVDSRLGGSTGFTNGNSFIGSYTFDPTALDTNPATTSGVYRSLTNWTVQVGAHTATFVSLPPVNAISVANDLFFTPTNILDVYGVHAVATGMVVNGLAVADFDLTLQDNSHTAFNSDALPATPPSLNSFANRTLRLRFLTMNGGLAHVQANVASLTAVPVPAAVLLFGTGLTALISLGAGSRRRKQIRVA